MKPVSSEIFNTAWNAALNDKLRFKNFTDSIAETIENNLAAGRKRFNLLQSKFDEEFPEGSKLRGAGEALLWSMMESPLELYFIGNNSALILELHAFLERMAINELPKLLAVNEKSEEIIGDLISRKTLIDIAFYFVDLEIWDKEDQSFIKKLSQIRNGIAHKNPEMVSKYLGDGKSSSLYSINEITKKVDCIPYIINSLKLMINVSGFIKLHTLKSPKFEARLHSYRSIISRIFNLFMEPDIQKLIEPVKRLVIGQIISEALLLASEELGDLLICYQQNVIEFQEQLNKDEYRSKELHTELLIMCQKIFYQMRADLGLSDDDNSLLKPQ